MPNDLSLRVLVLAQFGRDTELLQSFLHRHKFCSHKISGPRIFSVNWNEAPPRRSSLKNRSSFPFEEWRKRLELQPTWSDFPLIILTSSGTNPSIVQAELTSFPGKCDSGGKTYPV